MNKKPSRTTLSSIILRRGPSFRAFEELKMISLEDLARIAE
ncbi:hypothetical protein [Acetomicrobium sp. S15 = DSM 107314]|nr:hypothetical protein [Acetomicrobium sp. S15 = DSM 107314]